MTVKEILDIEKINRFGIILLKEGMFYRAYNVSAMRISTKIKTLKVNTKFVKAVGQAILYCGFPENILPGVRDLCAQKNYGWRVYGEKRIDILDVATPDENYEVWSREVLSKAAVTNTQEKKEENVSSVTPVVEKHYDLVMWFMPKLSNFPRDQRYVLADRIGVLLLDILGLLTEAVYSPDRAEVLRSVNVRLDQLRYLVRITKDMKYISISQYDFFTVKTVEIGRMVGGWKRTTVARNAREAVSTDAACGGEQKGEVQAEDRACLR
jgi:hypothetical protein